MTQRLRMVLAIVLLVVGCIAIPLSATAWWVRGTVTDTDQFVDTLGPLAEDPDVQDAVERQLVTQVMDLIERQQLLAKASEDLAELGVPDRVTALLPLLADPIRDRIEQRVTRIAERVVESPAFAEAWDNSLEQLHGQFVEIITSDHQSDVITTDDGNTLNLELATLTETVRLALQNAGVPGANLLPTVDVTIPIMSVEQITAARAAYDAIDRWGRLLPLLTIVLLAAGIALTRDRPRAGRILAVAAVGVLVLTLLGVAWGRQFAVDQLPSQARDAGTAMLAILTDRLRAILRFLAVIALLAGAVLLFAGNDRAATSRRRRAQQLYDRGLRAADRWPHTWLAAGGVAALALLVLLVVDPGPLVMLLLLAIGGAAGWLAYVTRPDPGPTDEPVPEGAAVAASDAPDSPPGAEPTAEIDHD